VRYVPVGPDDPEVGPPTQMAVFDDSTHGGSARAGSAEEVAA
jgi:hypothetical protein